MVGVIVPGMAVYGTPSTLQISPYRDLRRHRDRRGRDLCPDREIQATFTFVGDTGGVASTTLTVTQRALDE